MIKRTLAVSAATAAIILSTGALAADPFEHRPEVSAYVTLAFGGSEHPGDSLKYGLRLDHDSRLQARPINAIASVDFDRQGFKAAQVGGLPFVRSLRLQQYGGEYQETHWTATDWALLALGVVGLGAAVAAVIEADDVSDDPETTAE